MDIHEYQAKKILQHYGIPIPPFVVIRNLDEVPGALDELNLETAVLKTQVHAGGRGKAGGVKIAKTREEAQQHAKQLLGMKIVNTQTGARGLISHEVMLTAPAHIQREFYIGAIIDRKQAQAMIIASPQGGSDIEEVAKADPHNIVAVPIAEDGAVRKFHLLRIAKLMGWHGDLAIQGMAIISALAKAFVETDASLLEINPLIEADGKLWALDAKLAVDDNALYRQPEIAALYDPRQYPATEVAAKKLELSYISLEGNIGCMVNGAGLAMATMDIIKHYGGTPANFLDVGGGASKEKVAEGFKLILADPNVKAILVNIFGGIMNCATLAEGIVSAANELEIHVPLVVRMEGTNVEQGKKILADSSLRIIIAQTLAEAAEKAVIAAKRGE